MSQPLLGEYVDNTAKEDLISDLRDEVETLRVELVAANARARQAESSAARSVSRLRQVLTPLYSGMCELFGEMDKVAPAAEVSAATPRASAVWEAWKSKMPGKPAAAIDALLLHGEMNSQAIAVAIGMHRNNVPKVMHRLNQAGILGKNGNKYFLKQS